MSAGFRPSQGGTKEPAVKLRGSRAWTAGSSVRIRARLESPEGDLVLLPGALSTRVGENGVGELVRGSEVLARAGSSVTLFGGIGADGTMVVCGLEQVHS